MCRTSLATGTLACCTIGDLECCWAEPSCSAMQGKLSQEESLVCCPMSDLVPCQAEASPLAVQDELRKGESGLLHRVMTAFSRPTRIVRGKDVAASWQVREELFELEEEAQLLAAFQRVQGQVRSFWNCTQVCKGDRGCLCASPDGYAGAGEGREDISRAGVSAAGRPS